MTTPQIDTLLELYDPHMPILNVAGAWYIQPRTVVYFYYELDEDPAALRKELAQMFSRIGLRCSVRMEKLTRLDMRDMLDWVTAHRDSLGEFAIELTGGDDEMLFSAGLCYAGFPCRLFARKPDGRYIALPSGEELHAGHAAFTIDARLSLNDVMLDRYGRLTPNDLGNPELIALAHRLFDLQKKHPVQWTRHTKCIQQCVSRAADDALTVLLDRETCRACSVSAAGSKLLPSLLRAGALTSVKHTDEGILVTFKDLLVRDCLCDYGVWLEISAYDALVSSGVYDSVRMSCVVRWENQKLVNELDVVATAGLGLLIVSCKTCTPDMKAVAELNVLGDRLGSSHTQTVLAALPKANERLGNIRARCEEMGVQLVDLRQYDRQGLQDVFARIGRRLRAGRQ